MESTVGTRSEKEEFWRSHVARCEDYVGSIQKYCLENKLKPSTFRNYKRKFGFANSRRKRLGPFAKVKVNSVESRKPVQDATISRGLPDPKWLAIFVRSFLDEK